jgi:hypothetical protein
MLSPFAIYCESRISPSMISKLSLHLLARCKNISEHVSLLELEQALGSFFGVDAEIPAGPKPPPYHPPPLPLSHPISSITPSPPPPSSTPSMPSVVPRHSKKSATAQLNTWNNYQEKDTGVVFMLLPGRSGDKNRRSAVAVGIQDLTADLSKQGLDSVIPLHEGSREFQTCMYNGWSVLTSERMEFIKEKDKKTHDMLATWRAHHLGMGTI